MKNSLSMVFLAMMFAGCEKIVDLKYKSNQSRIIIEGNITNGPGPYFVKITKSVALSSTGMYPGVDSAVVVISDDTGDSEVLGFQGGGTYRTASLAGKEGRTYTLTVQVGEQTYIAKSTMPKRVPFDSMKVEEVKVIDDTDRNIIPVYRDPVEKGNNYRFVMTVNNKLLNQHFVQNDEVKNGVVNTVGLAINDDDLKLKRGDSVVLEMQCVDKDVASYYTTLALIADSGPGGGTTPNNPPNNISNGGIGIVFGAYYGDAEG